MFSPLESLANGRKCRMEHDTMLTEIEREMITAIRANPGSLVDILAYGDWLLERGDPRGEWIQMVCNPALQLPIELDGAERLAAKRKREQVSTLGVACWAALLKRFEARAVCHGNGLPLAATMTAERFVEYGDELLARAPIDDLRLEFPKQQPVSERLALCRSLACCPALAHLTNLHIINAGITDEDLAVLLESPYIENLDELDLNENWITSEGAAMLSRANLPKMAVLDLRGNPVDLEGIEHLRQSTTLVSLRKLWHHRTHAAQEEELRGGGTRFLISLRLARAAA